MTNSYKSVRDGEAVSSLDLRTLTDYQHRAMVWGASLEGAFGASWGWTINDFGDGHFEVVGVYSDDGHKVGKVKKSIPKTVETFEEFCAFLEADMAKTKKRAKTVDDMTPETIERSLRRTRKVIREKCLMMRADKLLTFTTRASITDSEIFKSIVTKFLKRCRLSEDDFKYVAVFERHMSEKTSPEKYGSLHLHVAIAGYCSYKKLRHYWRQSVQDVLKDGDYEGANIDASEFRRNGLKSGHYNRAKIASYMSKYITKDMDNDGFEPNKRRYWASRNIEPPKKTRIFTAPAINKQTYLTIFSDILGVNLKKMFMPEFTVGGSPPTIWLST